jgi:hypothetical protein
MSSIQDEQNNSDIYILYLNDLPVFYLDNEKTVSDKMIEIGQKLAVDEFLTGYRTELVQINEHEIHLLGSYRFFLVAYDTVIHRIRYEKILKYV